MQSPILFYSIIDRALATDPLYQTRLNRISVVTNSNAKRPRFTSTRPRRTPARRRAMTQTTMVFLFPRYILYIYSFMLCTNLVVASFFLLLHDVSIMFHPFSASANSKFIIIITTTTATHACSPLHICFDRYCIRYSSIMSCKSLKKALSKSAELMLFMTMLFRM